MTSRHWHMHIKTTEGGFYIHKRPFPTLEKAKEAVRKYEKKPPPWLAEARIYRVEEGETCETCGEEE